MTLAVSIAQSGANNVTFRNKIINGSFGIDQRNAGASATPSGTGATYYLDRWYYYASQASKFTMGQNLNSIAPPAGFSTYYGLQVASAVSIGATDRFLISQGIEANNIADWSWGTANAATTTLSFWVRSSLTGTFGGGLQCGQATYTYPFTYTINSANTWEYKTVVIAAPTGGGTWTPNNNGGVYVQFSLGCGTTYSGTAGSWSGTNYNSATGATSVVGTGSATFYITGVQLEAGTTATPFEQRLYGTELALCQRYYEKVHYVMCGYYNGSNGVVVMAPQNVQKRAQPTVTRTNDGWGTWNVNLSTYNEGVDGYTVYCYPTGSSVGFIRMSTDLLISAEL